MKRALLSIVYSIGGISISNKVLLNIESLCEEKIKEKGFELEYVEMVKENSNDILRVVIDKENYDISSEDCEIISRYIEDDVDKMMKDKEYVLEVSSAGLEKALKNIHLFKKYVEKRAFIRLFKKTKLSDSYNEKEFEAIIYNVDEENGNISLKMDNGEVVKINFEDIASAHTVFDFETFFRESK